MTIETIRTYRRILLILLMFMLVFISCEIPHRAMHGGYRSALMGVLPLALIVLGVYFYSRIANIVLCVFHAYFLVILVKSRPGLFVVTPLVFQGGIFLLLIQNLRGSFAYHRLKRLVEVEDEAEPEETSDELT